MAEEHRHVHDHGGGQDIERPRVLVFFDYACPFCYVDHHRFEALRREIDFEVVLVPFELRPGMDEPIDLAGEGTGHSDRVDEYLERIAEKEGFPFVQPGLLPNTHRAIVLGELARDRGEALHRAVHAAIFEAYFVQGRDIGSDDTLLEIGVEAGLAPEEIEAAWAQGAFDDPVHQFRHLALSLGLDGTPAALICNELLIGSRPAGILRAALKKCDSRLEAAREGVIEDGDSSDDPRVRPSDDFGDASASPKR